MERFTSRRQAPSGQPAPSANIANQVQETFSEMASATANRSGLTGKLLVISLIIVSIAITGFVGFAIVSGVTGKNTVNKDLYQAVFLTDGQIYFGKLSNLDKEYAELKDIYYLQVDQQVQPDREKQQQANISLAKLGKELHGPEDRMFINPDMVLFWENLKTDGQVTQAIKNYQSSGGQSQQQTQTQQNTSTEQKATEDSSNSTETSTPAGQ